MNTVFQAIFPFGYPIGTLFSRQHAQHTDIIHTMHTMNGRDEKGMIEEYILI